MCLASVLQRNTTHVNSLLSKVLVTVYLTLALAFWYQLLTEMRFPVNLNPLTLISFSTFMSGVQASWQAHCVLSHHHPGLNFLLEW